MNLSKLRPCDACRGPIGLIFYHVQVSQHVVDPTAARQRLGLEMMFGGSAALADVFCPAGDSGTTEVGCTELFLCTDCWCRSGQATLAYSKRNDDLDRPRVASVADGGAS